ncbi:hypothetical protein AC249_AIPGENE29054 [Exaiptasia diaphana]|nr:hypothetical protein AC249_AIPGENE29054 [Exaiptasia diaphana]
MIFTQAVVLLNLILTAVVVPELFFNMKKFLVIALIVMLAVAFVAPSEHKLQTEEKNEEDAAECKTNADCKGKRGNTCINGKCVFPLGK